MYYNELNLPPSYIRKDLMFEQLKSSIYNCRACEHSCYSKPLDLTLSDVSCGEIIMIIGERPDEVNPLTPEGKLLHEVLEYYRFDKKQVYLTALQKCTLTKTPQQCYSFLMDEILCLKPYIVVALGDTVSSLFSAAYQKGGYVQFSNGVNILATHALKECLTQADLFQQLCHHFIQASQYTTAYKQELEKHIEKELQLQWTTR